MTALQFIRMYRIYREFKKGHANLKKAMERLDNVRQGLIEYHAKHQSTMEKDWGRFPNHLIEALEYISDAYLTLDPPMPMRDLSDALSRIKEMSERERRNS